MRCGERPGVLLGLLASIAHKYIPAAVCRAATALLGRLHPGEAILYGRQGDFLLPTFPAALLRLQNEGPAPIEVNPPVP